MLQKMSDQHKISFLDEIKATETHKKKENESKQTIQQIEESQKAKHLENKDDGLMTSHHISSARTGEVNDEGGPSKYIKSESSNTLWDSEKTQKLSEDMDGKTRIVKEKKVIADNKRYAEQKRINDLVEVLKSTDQTKAAEVSPSGTFSGSNYQTPTGNMSIFDSKDFERLPEKTNGEQVTEDNSNRRSQKDDSWRDGGKSVKVSEMVSGFFDQLLNKKD